MKYSWRLERVGDVRSGHRGRTGLRPGMHQSCLGCMLDEPATYAHGLQ